MDTLGESLAELIVIAIGLTIVGGVLWGIILVGAALIHLIVT